MFEMLIGVVFAAAVIAIPYLHERMKRDGGFNFNFSLPKLSMRSKKTEEKIKEIDKKLDEVVSSGFEGSPQTQTSDAELTKIEQMASKNVEISENLLSEMETTSKLTAESAVEESASDDALPDIPELPDLDMNSDLEVDTEDISIGLGDEEEEEEEEKIDFDDEDDLISSLAKEVEVKEEEEIDLLRDLKGQKFDINELEQELKEVVSKLKVYS
jgi:hypothetical protein